MSESKRVTQMQVEDYVFPPMVKPPGSDKTFFLAGAGERGRSDIDGTYVKYTAIGVYLEDDAAIQALAPKWKGKTAAELTDSVEFIRDVITGPFEKFTQVTMIQPLTGHQYSVNMAKWFEDIWRSQGIFTDSEAKALQTYLEVFDDKKFSPGDSILFTQAPTGKFTIGFSKHDNIPKDGVAVIQNTTFPQQILISMIGENGVCPGARQTLAARMSELLK
uniref:Chalcone-flavonone isomerase family protein n=1 Tax=Dianthus caryophyllus TaxID=3570 RepID=A0A2Z6DTM9_DIACA|nr:chalcone isomerase [Dianthus caryophyllus]BBD75330.1 Chalcone isomerase [Dianthus caryophyllus]BBD75331.1 Chalcone isomerase [Dianthus caryophyllus]